MKYRSDTLATRFSVLPILAEYSTHVVAAWAALTKLRRIFSRFTTAVIFLKLI
jgi:hypothetical protein